MGKDTSQTIKINISKQKLYLNQGCRILKVYLVSTSKFGIGRESGSSKTPLGLHRIANKIGRNAPMGSVFVRRINTGRLAKIQTKMSGRSMDLITSRIMRLEGLERGVNKGIGIDTYQRCIYIHGTPEEWLIGKSVSHGCIRMRNKDIIELFDLVKRGTIVYIER